MVKEQIKGPPPVLICALFAALSYYSLCTAGNAYSCIGFVILSIALLVASLATTVFIFSSTPILPAMSLSAVYNCTVLRRYAYAAVLGLVYGLSVSGLATHDKACFGMDPPKISSIQGVLASDPRSIQGAKLLVEIKLESCSRKDICTVQASGRLKAFMPMSSICKGTRINLDGHYMAAKDSFEAYFNADAYTILNGAPTYERIREYWRRTCVNIFQDRPWGALSAALLLGIRDDLDADLSEAYRVAGCAHILALSGMHLAVLSSLVALVLKKFFGLRIAALTGSIIMFLYVLFVGAQASLLRALLMFCIAAFALVRGYPRPVSSIISCAFLLQTGLDPSSAQDLSFILSYTALCGIVFLSSSIDELLCPYIPPLLSKAFSASLGAFIATASICAFYFGILRPAGLFAGLLLAPLGSLLLLGSLSFLILSFISPVLAEIPASIMNILYCINDAIVRNAARLPGFKVNMVYVLLLLSLAVSFLLVYLRRRGRNKRMYFEPFSEL